MKTGKIRFITIRLTIMMACTLGTCLQPLSGVAQAVGGATAADLSASGKTIPDTNYVIPTGAIYMATSGKDTNSGSKSKPVKTLNRAVSVVSEGGTIVVRAGVYRDAYRNAATGDIINKRLTIQAYPHEKVWFDGTNTVPTSKWTKTTVKGKSAWYISWSTPDFCSDHYDQLTNGKMEARACFYDDEVTDKAGKSHPVKGDPQMVFVNGTYVTQAESLNAIVGKGSQFYYNHAKHRIYIDTNPKGKTIEITKRANALVLGSSPSAVKGIGFRRYATRTNGFDTGLTKLDVAAVYMGGSPAAGKPGSVVENSVFYENAGDGLRAPMNQGRVSHSVFVKNGLRGLTGGGSGSKGSVNNLVVENSLFDSNNYGKFDAGDCKAYCTAAAMKVALVNGMTVRGNIFANTKGNRGAGVWCDNDCNNVSYIENVSHHNTGDGLYYEVSSNAIVASNLVYSNGRNGIRLSSASAYIVNNTFVNNKSTNIEVYDDKREPGKQPSKVGPNTSDIHILGNILYGLPTAMINVYYGRDSSTNTRPSQFLKELDYNAFYWSSKKTKLVLQWTEGPGEKQLFKYKTLTDIRKDHPNFTMHDVKPKSGAGNPFFVSVSKRDFRVRTNSVASAHHKGGVTLPKKVADVLHLDTKTVYDRGAINWPGKK